MKIVENIVPEVLYHFIKAWFPSIYSLSFDGYYIAGGFIRDALLCRRPKDMDIFFERKEKIADVALMLENIGYEKVKETVFAITYRLISRGYDIQLIKKPIGSIEQMFENFDFTVCQVAVKGEYMYSSETFFNDLNAHRLVLTPAALERWGTTLERMFRYASYGFKPTRDTLTQIVHMVKDADEEDLFIDARIKHEIAASRSGEIPTGVYWENE